MPGIPQHKEQGMLGRCKREILYSADKEKDSRPKRGCKIKNMSMKCNCDGENSCKGCSFTVEHGSIFVRIGLA